MLYLNATSASGTAATLRQLPHLPGRQTPVVITRNGVPPKPSSEPDAPCVHVMVSKAITTRERLDTGQEAVVLQPGGCLQIDRRDSLLPWVIKAFGRDGPIRIEAVDDIRATQFQKIGVNTVLNSACTVFNKTKEELFSDPRDEMRMLVYGLAAETLRVARALGIDLAPDAIVRAIDETVRIAPKHRTSMAASFNAGGAIEVDVLSGGIADYADELGVKAPLCRLMTQVLTEFQARRDALARAPGNPAEAARLFRERDADFIESAQDDLLALARQEFSRQPDDAPRASPVLPAMVAVAS